MPRARFRSNGWLLGPLAALALVGAAALDQTIFEDRFDGKLGAGWTWLLSGGGFVLAAATLAMALKPAGAPRYAPRRRASTPLSSYAAAGTW